MLDDSGHQICTYILKCESNEFYCGKCINLDVRLKEHKLGINGGWFCNSKRRNFKLIYSIDENIEKKIKSFGIEKFYNIVKRGCPLS